MMGCLITCNRAEEQEEDAQTENSQVVPAEPRRPPVSKSGMLTALRRVLSGAV